ncbi:hypothetical protein ACFYXS_15370 [Streptomyces sp. NPDC002574]|uniref:hypothetical protein n=1 Tax=Streptomyces sp. NPDC002574 TaxID=3364652 RepID=UPI0036AAB711
MSASFLYRLMEPLPDAETAVARARALLRSHGAPGYGKPWVDHVMVTTAGQLAHVVATFPRAHLIVGWVRDPSAEAALLAELDGRHIGYRIVEDGYRLLLELELRPELMELWPFPDDVWLSLGWVPPFGHENVEDEDCSTEAEVDAMAAVLGPLMVEVQWEYPLRGLPDGNLCGVQLCLNSEWTSQHAEYKPGAFNVYLSIGTRRKNRAVTDEWLRDSGLALGDPQPGW